MGLSGLLMPQLSLSLSCCLPPWSQAPPNILTRASEADLAEELPCAIEGGMRDLVAMRLTLGPVFVPRFEIQRWQSCGLAREAFVQVVLQGMPALLCNYLPPTPLVPLAHPCQSMQCLRRGPAANSAMGRLVALVTATRLCA